MTLWLIPVLILASWLVLEVIARLAPMPRVRRLRGVMYTCGCLFIEGVLACPCAMHDPGAEPPVEQWAADLEGDR